MNRICSALLCLAGLSACASDPDSVDRDSVDFRVAHQESWLPRRGHEIWLFVGDDANSDAAAALRNRVAAALRLPEGGPYDGSYWLCPGDGFDPSHEDPIDIRVVVAHPSLPDRERFTTPLELLELARIGERDDLPAHERWLDAVRAELLRKPSEEPTNYSPIETIASALSLYAGQRGPNSLREQEQLRLLDESRPLFVRVFAFSTREDASLAAASSYDVQSLYDLDPDNAFYFELRSLFSPAPDTYVPLWQLQEASLLAPRWFEFLQLLEPGYIHWSFDSPENFFHSTALQSKTVQRCFNAPPKRHEDGSVDCRIHIATGDLAPCDATRGWLDPLTSGDSERRSPRLETDGSGSVRRVCEIRQLEAEALSRCLEQPSEPQHNAGWCYPEPSESCISSCWGSSYPASIRYVGGSTRVDGPARLNVDCSLETGE